MWSQLHASWHASRTSELKRQPVGRHALAHAGAHSHTHTHANVEFRTQAEGGSLLAHTCVFVQEPFGGGGGGGEARLRRPSAADFVALQPRSAQYLLGPYIHGSETAVLFLKPSMVWQRQLVSEWPLRSFTQEYNLSLLEMYRCNT